MLDLGAAPGGWSQVAAKRGAAQVVGLDLLPVDPVHGAVFLQGDFTDPAMPERLAGMLGGKVDLVLSDMAPNTTGHTATDHLRIMALAEMALDFARQILAPGGSFVAKVFQGGSERAMLRGDEARFRERPARQAACEPQGVERALRDSHRLSRPGLTGPGSLRRACAPFYAGLCGAAKVGSPAAPGIPSRKR